MLQQFQSLFNGHVMPFLQNLWLRLHISGFSMNFSISILALIVSFFSLKRKRPYLFAELDDFPRDVPLGSDDTLAGINVRIKNSGDLPGNISDMKVFTKSLEGDEHYSFIPSDGKLLGLDAIKFAVFPGSDVTIRFTPENCNAVTKINNNPYNYPITISIAYYYKWRLPFLLFHYKTEHLFVLRQLLGKKYGLFTISSKAG